MHSVQPDYRIFVMVYILPVFNVASHMRLEHRENEERTEEKRCSFIYGTIFLVFHEVYGNSNYIFGSASEQKDFSGVFAVRRHSAEAIADTIGKLNL